MRTFAYNAARFADFRKIILMKSVPATLLATAAGLYLGLRDVQVQPGPINMVLIVVPLAIVLGLFSLWKGLARGIKRQRALYESFRLTIDDGGITRMQLDTPTIRIANEDINRIVKSQNGSYTITGKNQDEVIVIDTRINNHDELEQLLLRIKTFDDTPQRSLLAKYPNLPAIGVTLLFVAVFLPGNKVITTVCGVLLVVLLGWAILVGRKSKNIDAQSRRGLYLVLVPVYAILAKLFYLWF